MYIGSAPSHGGESGLGMLRSQRERFSQFGRWRANQAAGRMAGKAQHAETEVAEELEDHADGNQGCNTFSSPCR